MNALQQQISEDIRLHGPLPFVDFMNYCLYAPGHGYYASGKAIFGAEGDFVTAPELGSLFAETLARPVLAMAEQGDTYDILEIGAGSGQLAFDLLKALHQLERLPGHYRILEKSDALRQRQQDRLARLGLPVTLEWLDEPPGQAWQGIVIANEVLDALPVEHFQVADGTVERMAVAVNHATQLEWRAQPATAALTQAVTRLQQTLATEHEITWPSPYRSEICLQLPDFIDAISANLNAGEILLIDYGYLRHEFYHPQRHMGTLVSHQAQQGHFDILADPGGQDITAFVDFSAVMDAAEACGLTIIDYQTQANFLISAGIEQVMQNALADCSTQAALERSHEMKQLMLPGEMGEKFKVLRLRK